MAKKSGAMSGAFDMTQPPVNEMAQGQLEVESELERLRGQDIATKTGEILARVAKDGDIDRIITGAALVNTFNFAIQQQAKRVEWTAKDYQSFCIALAALDQIS